MGNGLSHWCSIHFARRNVHVLSLVSTTKNYMGVLIGLVENPMELLHVNDLNGKLFYYSAHLFYFLPNSFVVTVSRRIQG